MRFWIKRYFDGFSNAPKKSGQNAEAFSRRRNSSYVVRWAAGLPKSMARSASTFAINCLESPPIHPFRATSCAASRTRLKCSAVVAGIRTIGTPPIPPIAWNMAVAVSMPMGLCSVSTTSQSKPSVATASAVIGLPMFNQVPMAGRLSRSRRFTGFGRIAPPAGLGDTEDAAG